MTRKAGSTNKEIKLPEVFTMTAEQRLEMLAAVLVDIISEELCEVE